MEEQSIHTESTEMIPEQTGEDFSAAGGEEESGLPRTTQEAEEQPTNRAAMEAAFRRAVEPELARLKEQDGDLYEALDADTMLSQPRFLQLLGAGLNIEEVYQVLNQARVQERLLQKARADVIRDIEARGLRPAEGAAHPSGAGSAALDIEGLTREELRDIRRRVLRGEQITL